MVATYIIITMRAQLISQGQLFINNDGYYEYGSVIMTDSDLNITDCVFLSNTGNVLGGYQQSSTADITILNSIFWDNTIIRPSYYYNITTSVSYSCIEGGYAGTGNNSSLPQFCNPFEHPLTLSSSSPLIGIGWFNENIGGLEVGCDIPSTTFYVAYSGSNNNIGSQSHPLLSIQKTIDRISHGDTVLIAPGVYEENIDIIDKNITLGSYFINTKTLALLNRP